MNKTIMAVALLSFMGVANASPGDDGCVGNCGGSNGTPGNSTSSVGNINNRNTNTNIAGALAGAKSRANSNASSNSKSLGVGIGVGGNSRSNANATGGNASSSLSNKNVANGGTAKQGQLQGQAQGQSSEQANSQTVNFNEANGMHYSGSYDVKTVGVAIPSNVQPTAGCRKPLNAAAGWLGGAVSFGTTFLDETCVTFEFIRFAQMSQDPKVRALGAELMTYGLNEQLATAREAEAKANKAEVNAYRPRNEETGVTSNLDHFWAMSQGG